MSAVELFIQTNKPGEVYIPFIGKTFYQHELTDYTLVTAQCDDKWSGLPGVIYPRTSTPRRIDAGSEVVFASATWIPDPSDKSDDVIRFGVNRRRFTFEKMMLRVASQPHLPQGHDWNLWTDKLMELLESPDDSLKHSAIVRFITVLERYHKLPTVGIQLRVPIAVKDNDDLHVEGLSSGYFLLQGIRCAHY